ncbi:MAG: LamG domain-containing protein [archaeon]
MVTERYIRRGGKDYGPYYYESYRDSSGSVKKRYLPDYKPPVEHKGIKLFVAVVAAVALLLLFFVFLNQQWGHHGLTGNVVYIDTPIHKLGQEITGKVMVNQDPGEAIPADSIVKITFGSDVTEFSLRDVVDYGTEYGAYYAKGVDLEGEGDVFGIKGTKEVYQTVEFELEIYEEAADGGSDDVIQESPPEGEGEEVEDVPEEVSEVGEEDSSGEEVDGGEEVETAEDSGSGDDSSESVGEESEGEGGVITGQAISEIVVETVSGSVINGADFTHELEDGQRARIVSVEFDGEEISESEISLDVEGNALRVSTDYSIEEEGFGPDFDGGSEGMTFLIKLEDLDLEAINANLEIEISYEGKRIAYFEEAILVGEDSVESALDESLLEELPSQIQLLQDIPSVRIPFEGNVVIDLGDYFSDAKEYTMNVEDIVASFEGDLLDLTAVEGFKGARKAKIAAWAGNEMVESNEFLILVSSGAVSIETTRSKVELGKAVKWKKKVSMDDPDEINIEIPEEAENVEVKVVNGGEERVVESIDGPISPLTGGVVIEVDLDGKKKRDFSSPVVNSFKIWFAGFKAEFSEKLRITGRASEEVLQSPQKDEVVDIVLDESGATEYIIEYETAGPEAVEEDLGNGGKLVTIMSDVEGYTDVIVHAELDNSVSVGDQDKINVYWHRYEDLNEGEVKEATEKRVADVLDEEVVETVSMDDPENPVLTGNVISTMEVKSLSYVREEVAFDAYDLDGDDMIDYVEWVVPHLSNQTYEIVIEIIKAEHLDWERIFVSDIYSEVSELDGVWSETIPEGHYVRIVFERNLTSENDITVYPRAVNGTPRIEVYEFGGMDVIAEFEALVDDKYNTVYLTGLSGEQDTFDLRVVGGAVEFDHIIDPTQTTWCYQETANVSTVCGGLSNGTYGFYYTVADWPNKGYLYDGNWTTYTGAMGFDYFYINYTKPEGANSSSIFTYKCGNDLGVINFTMGSKEDCWVQSPLRFRIYSTATDAYTNVSCWDGIQWDTIEKYTTNPTFYEEGMWWYSENVTDLAPGIEFGSDTTSEGIQTNDDIYVDLDTSDESDHYSFVDFDNDVVLWMRMDDVNGSGDPIDLSSYGNNGTLIDDTVINSSFGYFGNGSYFDYDGDYINVPYDESLSFNSSGQYTWALWINIEDIPDETVGVFSKTEPSAGVHLLLSDSYGSKTLTYFCSSEDDTLEGCIRGSYELSYNNWIFLAFTYDNGTVKSYVNGTLDYTNNSLSFTSSNAYWYQIGRSSNNHANYDFWGEIDEFMVFQRNLSLPEIQSLYNASANQYLNNFTGLSEGNHSFTGYAVDVLGNKNQTEERTVTINVTDVTGPEITIITPLNNSNYNASCGGYNVSLNENTSWCGYSFNGGANVTMTKFNDTYFYSSLCPPEGLHNILFTCNDTSNNFGVSDMHYFLFDRTNPNINFTAPTPDNGSTQTTNNIFVNLSTNDTNEHYALVDFDRSLVLFSTMDSLDGNDNPLDYSSYGNNGTSFGNATSSNFGKFGKSFSFEGLNGSVINYGSDSSLTFNAEGNYTWSMWTYSTGADNAKGVFEIKEFDGMGIATGISMFFDFSLSKIVIQNISRNGVISLDTCPQKNEWAHTVLIYSNGSLDLYLNGQLNVSANASINFASTGMGLRVGQIMDQVYVPETEMFFEGFIDEFLMFNRSLSAAEILSLYNASANQYANNFTGLSVGTHTFKGHAVDVAGNKNETEERSVTVSSADTTSPNINFTDPTPSNGSSQTNAEVYVNLSTNDTNDHYAFVDFDNDVVLWLRMDDVNGSGDPTDLSSYGNNGSLINDTVINSSFGYFGNGSHFDYVGDYIQVPYAESLSFNKSGQYTWAFWMNIEDIPDETVGVFSKREPSAGVHLLLSDAYDSKTLTYFCANEDAALGDCIRGSYELNYNDWIFLAFTYDNGTVKSYVNNTLDYTNDSLSFLSSNAYWYQIGRSSNNHTEYDFWGEIDEFMVFQRNLSAAEIQSLYNASAMQYEHNFVSLTDGAHSFVGHVCDTSGNCGQTEERQVLVDTIVPLVNFTSPTPQNGSSQSNDDIYVNLSTSDSNYHYAFVDFDSDLVLWMRMDDFANSTYNVDEEYQASYSGDCGGDIANAYDENWGSQGGVGGPSTTCYVHVNYSVPALTQGASNEIKTVTSVTGYVKYECMNTSGGAYVSIGINNQSGEVRENVSIPDSCIGDELVLRYGLVSTMGIVTMHEDQVWWTVSNTSVVADISGYANNGTVLGDAVQTGGGYYGKGFEFDGSDGINIGDAGAVEVGTSDFSVSFWVKTSDTGGSGPGTQGGMKDVIGKRYPGDQDSPTKGWGVGVSSDYVGVEIDDSADHGTFIGSSTTNISDDQWHHVVVVFDRDVNGSIYVDTLLENQTDITSEDGSLDNSIDLRIAQSDQEHSYVYLEAEVDEVLIFKRALSLVEVRALYNTSAFRYYNNFTGLPVGDHDFRGFAVDAAGNLNQTELRSVTIESETDDPDIEFVLPTPNDKYVTGDTGFTVKVNVTTYNGTTIYNTRYMLFNSSIDIVNETYIYTELLPMGGSALNITYVGLDFGNYTYNVWVNDSEGGTDLTSDRVIYIVPSCLDLSGCDEESSCVVDEDCVLNNDLCDGGSCDFTVMEVGATIYTGHDSNGNGNDLTLALTSNTFRAPLTFLSNGAVWFSGNNGTDLGSGSAGGDAGDVNITVPDLFNTTNARFVGRGGDTTLDEVGGDGGDLMLYFHGLIRNFTGSTPKPDLGYGTNPGDSKPGHDGQLYYFKDLDTCPRDADVNRDGVVDLADRLNIRNNYNSLEGDVQEFDDYNINCDSKINVIELSKIGFEWYTR